MELNGRRMRVLSAIVDTYLATGEPAGSKHVAEMLGGEVEVERDFAGDPYYEALGALESSDKE